MQPSRVRSWAHTFGPRDARTFDLFVSISFVAMIIVGGVGYRVRLGVRRAVHSSYPSVVEQLTALPFVNPSGSGAGLTFHAQTRHLGLLIVRVPCRGALGARWHLGADPVYSGDGPSHTSWGHIARSSRDERQGNGKVRNDGRGIRALALLTVLVLGSAACRREVKTSSGSWTDHHTRPDQALTGV